MQTIVHAEHEARKILEDAQKRASAIRKQLDSSIEHEREELLKSAQKEADLILERAESEGKAEAQNNEKELEMEIRKTIASASAKKDAVVKRLVSMVLEEKNNVRDQSIH